MIHGLDDVSVSFFRFSGTHSLTHGKFSRTGLYDDEFSLAVAPFASGGRAFYIVCASFTRFWSQEWGFFVSSSFFSTANSSTTLGFSIGSAHSFFANATPCC